MIIPSYLIKYSNLGVVVKALCRCCEGFQSADLKQKRYHRKYGWASSNQLKKALKAKTKIAQRRNSAPIRSNYLCLSFQPASLLYRFWTCHLLWIYMQKSSEYISKPNPTMRKKYTPPNEIYLSYAKLEGNFLNLMETVYKIPTDNIILEKLKAFPLRSGTWQGFPFHYSF